MGSIRWSTGRSKAKPEGFKVGSGEGVLCLGNANLFYPEASFIHIHKDIWLPEEKEECIPYDAQKAGKWEKFKGRVERCLFISKEHL